MLVFLETNAALLAFRESLQPQIERLLADVQNASGRAAAKQLVKELRAAAFDPDQPRDEDGKWTDGGGSASSDHLVSQAEEKFPKLNLTEKDVSNTTLPRDDVYGGDDVDGLRVRTDIPNTDSISATYNEDEYESLPGIREVDIDSLGLEDYAAADDNQRVENLAERIKESEEISPLIVVYDQEGAYVLEGNHRARAVKKLGKKKVPALVIVEYPKEDKRDASQRMAAPRISYAFDVTDERAVDWVKKHALDLVDDLTETTREEIREEIEAAFVEQFDREELTERIEEIIGDADRAEMIARTETIRASINGQLQAWDQATDAGLLTGNESKEWITTPDDRLCPICEPLDGQTVPLAEQFDVEGEKIDGPPAHPRCRCAMGLSV